jgi:hypothetical protein
MKAEGSLIALVSRSIYPNAQYGDNIYSTISLVHISRGKFLRARYTHLPTKKSFLDAPEHHITAYSFHI